MWKVSSRLQVIGEGEHFGEDEVDGVARARCHPSAADRDDGVPFLE